MILLNKSARQEMYVVVQIMLNEENMGGVTKKIIKTIILECENLIRDNAVTLGPAHLPGI